MALSTMKNSQNCTFIKKLNPECDETLRIKVRVIRMWYTFTTRFSKEVSSINLVLLDEQNTKIEAVVSGGKGLINKHKNVLGEGRCYVIQNFHVALNDGNYRATNHLYKINFNWSTNVRPCEAEIPLYRFEFVGFEDVLLQRIPEQFLFDIIGEVVSFQPIQEGVGKNSVGRKMQMLIQDESGKQLVCALWDDVGDGAATELAKLVDTRIVVVIQLARGRKLTNSVILTNSLNATKVMFNPSLPEIEEFNQKLTMSDFTLSQRLTQTTFGPGNSSKSDSIMFDNKKTLIEIRNCEEALKCSTVATVYKIQSNYNWYYDACNVCKKKVKFVGDELYCYYCKKVPSATILRFRVQVMVMDSSGPASFVMFDREVIHFTKKEAAHLRDELMKDDDEFGFPVELNLMKGRKLLFNVEISDYNIKNKHRGWEKNAYKVLFISADEVELQKYIHSSDEAEEDASATSAHEVTSSCFVDSQNSGLLTQSQNEDATAVCLSEMENSSSNLVTPQKRIGCQKDEEGNESSHALTPQMSCNKTVKKIKSE